jgi:hypothetical protein
MPRDFQRRVFRHASRCLQKKGVTKAMNNDDNDTTHPKTNKSHGCEQENRSLKTSLPGYDTDKIYIQMPTSQPTNQLTISWLLRSSTLTCLPSSPCKLLAHAVHYSSIHPSIHPYNHQSI